MVTEPGTLLWIGPSAAAEFVDAFRFCRDHVGQMAVRRSLREAISRPAGYVSRIIIARPTRQLPRKDVFEQFVSRYSSVTTLALCGSLCDGEGRTGTPWPVSTSIRFSRWSSVLPRWLDPCGVRPPVKPAVASLLVISDRFEMAEPFLEAASHCGITANWNRRFIPAVHRSFQTILWDDSAARPAESSTWRQRLGRHDELPETTTGRAAIDAAQVRGLTPQSPRHLWIALQPSIDAITQAIDGGIAEVLTKPATIESIFQAAWC
jgi:hypothetical protein